MSDSDAPIPRRFELVLLDIINDGRGKCGLGFGKYPLGVREAVRVLMPLCNTSDPAYPSIVSALADFDERLSR